MYQAILAHFLVCLSFQQDKDQIKFSQYSTLLLTNRAVVIFNVTKVFCNRCENLFVFAAKSYCHPSPCLHGGSCVDIKDGYTCKCPGSYRGTNCEGITINSLQPRDNNAGFSQCWKVLEFLGEVLEKSFNFLQLWKCFLCFSGYRKPVADPGEGPEGPGVPLIFRPKWGPKGRKKLFWRPGPPPLSQGLADPPLPPAPIWRSGSGTEDRV